MKNRHESEIELKNGQVETLNKEQLQAANGSLLHHSPAVVGDVIALLERARGRTIVVVGDLMLDEWIIGNASRISPEAPVPVVRFVERHTAPGGAANVAMNLLRLGAQVRLCGVIGDDEAGADLAHELEKAGADIRGMVRDPSRPTTLKTRIVAQSQQQRQQMVRVDRESDTVCSDIVRQQMTASWASLLEGAAVLCISDYDKGFVSCPAAEDAIRCAKEMDIRVTGGPKPHNLLRFSGVDFLSLNQQETSDAANMKLNSEDAVREAGTRLLELTQCSAIAITRSEHGVMLLQREAVPRQIAAHAVEVFDGVGAGDTFLAAASLALAADADYIAAAQLGNLAAAASVRHRGVVAVTPDEVQRVAAE
ncbi:MAG: hypothetical protein JO316_16050 [Abitibacteriaceae bacterium]|nr:hypothetical protein [Abditibacteriaceae bacterium]